MGQRITYTIPIPRRDEFSAIFRAALTFPVSEDGYVVFGTPGFRDIGNPKTEAAEASKSTVFVCFNCLQPGHYANKCPRPRVKRFKNCGEVGHNLSKCPQPIKCTTCGSLHHTHIPTPSQRLGAQ